MKDYDAAVALWREWNEKINVVSRKDIDSLYEHHVLHSLAIAKYMELFYGGGPGEGESVLDLGTGGGLPRHTAGDGMVPGSVYPLRFHSKKGPRGI